MPHATRPLGVFCTGCYLCQVLFPSPNLVSASCRILDSPYSTLAVCSFREPSFTATHSPDQSICFLSVSLPHYTARTVLQWGLGAGAPLLGPEPFPLALYRCPFLCKRGTFLASSVRAGPQGPEVALTHWDRIIRSVRAWTEHGGGGRSDARSPPLALAVTRQHVVFLGFGAHRTSTLGSPSPLLPFSGLWTQAGWQLQPSWACGSQTADGGASQPP